MVMTPQAKSALSAAIRALRQRLLEDLHAATEGRYRLSAPIADAGLSEAERVRRQRLEAWLDEQVRTVKKAGRHALRDRFRQDVEKEAASTLLNRLILLRLLEAAGLSRPEVVTGGWNSKGYREFREWAPALTADETEGYATLLQLVFDELAQELPGLYGDVGLTSLVPIPPATLRAVVEALNDPDLESCWTDDTTLGWVYQYWNDPEREALDAKLNAGGKVEPHEIASKTQMFTERYIVEWLLQNSLGQMWLAMCEKHGWTPQVKARGVLDALEERRKDWRRRCEVGDVPADALMPIEGGLEEHWKYWVPQPMPQDAVRQAPDSVRSLKILDPACGSGHFLVIAFDLLQPLYREEAGHRGVEWSDREIAEGILEDNLHGVDIDPRAVQIAAAALYLKARTFCREAHPTHLNLVASNLRLAGLDRDDPALVELRTELREKTGIPERLTDRIVQALAGADHLGTLLRIDNAVDEAVGGYESGADGPQYELFADEAAATRRSLLDRLEGFLEKVTSARDLGLRLRGEQLAAGVRFIRTVKENAYDLVVGNPPYQGTSKMADAGYVAKHYPRGKADLYAAFLERGLQLVREGGMSALLTMRNWMFIQQYASLREHLLKTYDLRVLGDFAIGAFDAVPNDVLSVVVSVFRKALPASQPSVAVQPTPPDDRSYDRERTRRKRAAVLCQMGWHQFDPQALKAVPDSPIIYWWTTHQLTRYLCAERVGSMCPARFGLTTGNNDRFCRRWWEVQRRSIEFSSGNHAWVPFVLGAKGIKWFEPLSNIVRWYGDGIEVKLKSETQYGTVSKQIRNEEFYFVKGLSFAAIGNDFSVRAHRFPSVFSNAGLSLYPTMIEGPLASLNTTEVWSIINDLAPGIRFDVGDVNRLPLFFIKSADEIFATIEHAFSIHESHRESSVEFVMPGLSPWRYAQEWAQWAVDRAAGEPLPPYEPVYEPAPPESFVSFAVGVALGRFGADGEGILSGAEVGLDSTSERDGAAGLASGAGRSERRERTQTEKTETVTLPAGILFLSQASERDSLEHPACSMLLNAWKEHGPAIATGVDLRTWLCKSFFGEVHRPMYENRPIYFPLSSAKKNFVAFVSIHRWTEDTLRTLLADHLLPERKALEGQLEDLRKARGSGDKKAVAAAEKQFARVQKLHEELCELVDLVVACAEQGPHPPDSKTPPREADARYAPDLDDGVMINSAALWPLLEPQWKDPKKWWKELATADKSKDYDWSHLAARYFPSRIDRKCQQDPSLAVAHRCFWRYHPARAYAWELRLQDEIRPDFTIDEPGSDEARAAFLRDCAREAAEFRDKEQKRRERKARKPADAEQTVPGQAVDDEDS